MGQGGGTTTGLQGPDTGRGRLLERDYWGVIEAPRGGPEALAEMVAARFPAFAPSELATFLRPAESDGPLQVGDELEVRIVGAGSFGVRVVHRDSRSLTVATLPGHPEAGRITFGAYRNHDGDLVFHIRSRARSASQTRLIGFLFAGDPMQTNTWTDFVNQVGLTFGEGLLGMVHAEKRTVEPEPGDHALDRPTFRTRA